MSDIIYKGIKYGSFADLCRKYDVNYAFVKGKIRHGWSLEDAINAKNRKIVYKRVQYDSLMHLCRSLGIKHATVNTRLERGWDLTRAIRTPIKTSSILFNNKKFSSFRAMCIHYKMSDSIVRSRLKIGWTLKEALELEKRKNLLTDECDGEIYLITNSINSKTYVGLTTETAEKRFAKHIIAANNCSMTKLHTAILLLGKENFSVEVLKTANSRKELVDLEIFYINKYKSITNGYNTNKGGNLGRRLN